MTDAVPALSAVEAYLEALAAFRHSPDLVDPSRALMGSPASQRVAAAAGTHPAAIYEGLAAGLGRIADPYAAGVLAVQLGAMIELGADPSILGHALVARLPGDLAAATRFAEVVRERFNVEQPDRAPPETTRAAASLEPAGCASWAALGMTTPAAMAAWCRHAPSRRAASSTKVICEQATWLGERGAYAYFIGALLRAADGIELVVLSPEQKKGFLVELEVVRNAAHLFALLEDALVGEPSQGLLAGPRIDAEIARLARGEAFDERLLSYRIGWVFQFSDGLRDPMTMNVPSISSTIPFEAAIEDLPQTRGLPVVLMRPPGPPDRGCDANSFFGPLHDALHSAVRLKRAFDASEVEAWLRALPGWKP